MKPIEYLYDLVGQSNFTTIGYTFQDEKLKMNLFLNYLVLGIKK